MRREQLWLSGCAPRMYSVEGLPLSLWLAPRTGAASGAEQCAWARSASDWTVGASLATKRVILASLQAHRMAVQASRAGWKPAIHRPSDRRHSCRLRGDRQKQAIGCGLSSRDL